MYSHIRLLTLFETYYNHRLRTADVLTDNFVELFVNSLAVSSSSHSVLGAAHHIRYQVPLMHVGHSP